MTQKIKYNEATRFMKSTTKINTRNKVLEKTHGICIHCGKDLDLKTLSIDHFIPKAKGGKSRMSNMYPMCFDCNLAKGDKIIDINSYYNFLIPGTEKGAKSELEQWAGIGRKELVKLCSGILIDSDEGYYKIFGKQLDYLKQFKLKRYIVGEIADFSFNGPLHNVFYTFNIFDRINKEEIQINNIKFSIRDVRFNEWVECKGGRIMFLCEPNTKTQSIPNIHNTKLDEVWTDEECKSEVGR